MARFAIDFRFVNIERELWALGEFLKAIEPQVDYLRAQDRVQTHARLQEEGLEWEDSDTQLTLQELDERASTVFPRLLRNPFIVTLWAAFESAMVEIADSLAAVKKLELRLRDIRSNNSLYAADKYYRAVASTPLDEDSSRLDRLNDLLVVRNVVAHANGQQQAVPREKWARLEQVLAKHPTVQIVSGYLVVSSDYLDAAYGDVNGAITDLIDRVRGPAVRRIP